MNIDKKLEEFDQKFIIDFDILKVPHKRVKLFLRQALEQQKQELIDEIEKVIQEERYAGAPYALNKLIDLTKNK